MIYVARVRRDTAKRRFVSTRVSTHFCVPVRLMNYVLRTREHRRRATRAATKRPPKTCRCPNGRIRVRRPSRTVRTCRPTIRTCRAFWKRMPPPPRSRPPPVPVPPPGDRPSTCSGVCSRTRDAWTSKTCCTGATATSCTQSNSW